MEAMKQPTEMIPTMIWGVPSSAIAPVSAKTLIPRVMQKAAQEDDTPIRANTIPTMMSTTPAPPNPSSPNQLFIKRIILCETLNVNRDFDSEVKKLHPLTEGLEGRAIGNSVNYVLLYNGTVSQ